MVKNKFLTGTARELAGLLGISERRVNQLANEKIFVKNMEMDYDLPDSIARYYENKYASKDEDEYWSEKAKHEAAKRKLAELLLAKKQGNVHEAEDVELVMSDMLSNLRSQLLGMPTKLAPLLERKSKGTIQKILSSEISEKLEELSDYSPTLFDGENGGN